MFCGDPRPPRGHKTHCFPEVSVNKRRESRGHKTHCFPEISVNKCFVKVVYKCQSMNNSPVIGVNLI